MPRRSRPGRPPKNERQRPVDVVHLRRQASDYFLRAAAFLLDWHQHRDNAAAAMFYADLGLLRLAQSDDAMELHDKVLEYLEQFRALPAPTYASANLGVGL